VCHDIPEPRGSWTVGSVRVKVAARPGPLRHGGRLGDLGIALLWTVGAAAVAYTVVMATGRIARPRRNARPGSAADQLAAVVRGGWRDWRRNPVLWRC
jgi:hypothetical protein